MHSLDGKGGKPIARMSSAEETQGRESKRYSFAEKMGILQAEGATLIPQPSLDIPTTVNYSGFEADTQEHMHRLQRIAGRCAEVCRTYLEGYVIRDSFGNDHTARTEWRKAIGAKYGDQVLEMLYNNKLRINMITSVRNNMGTLTGFLSAFGAPSSKATAIEELCDRFPDCSSYEQLTDESKLEIVKQTEFACKSFLEIMAKE